MMAESQSTDTGVGSFLTFDVVLVQYGPCGPSQVSICYYLPLNVDLTCKRNPGVRVCISCCLLVSGR